MWLKKKSWQFSRPQKRDAWRVIDAGVTNKSPTGAGDENGLSFQYLPHPDTKVLYKNKKQQLKIWEYS